MKKSGSNIINDQLVVTLQKLTSVLEDFQKLSVQGEHCFNCGVKVISLGSVSAGDWVAQK